MTVKLESIAIQTCRMDPMVQFYSEAFGARFEPFEAGGLACRLGRLPDGAVIKLVPLRASVDFEGFPIHQLGFRVRDVEVVISAAQRAGGTVQDSPVRTGSTIAASVRDPDGNTLEVAAIAEATGP